VSVPCDISFRSMGSDVRLIVEAPLLARLPSPVQAAEAQRRYVEDFAARLSRFRPDSELSALNGDSRPEVPASILLRAAVSAGLWAARRSGGLVDPTLVDEIEAVGYARSQEGHTPASLADALAGDPPLRAARPSPRARWRDVEVDDERGTIRRPPGTGKGLAADAVAHRLRAYTRFVVDCGGDIAVGGVGLQTQPLDIEVEHPLTGESVHTLRLTGGGVATSGLNVRIWRDADGRYAHHLLDPSSGQPVWSGLIGATALAPSALEAETLTKMALLAGPMAARRTLAEHGGVIVHNDGDVELVGPLRASPGPLRLSGSAA
jgi:FAD:protein FMN transferase